MSEPISRYPTFMNSKTTKCENKYHNIGSLSTGDYAPPQKSTMPRIYPLDSERRGMFIANDCSKRHGEQSATSYSSATDPKLLYQPSFDYYYGLKR